MILMPNETALYWLNRILNPAGDQWVHIYANDVPLDLDTIKADLIEMTVPGYAAKLITGWTTPSIVARRAQTEGPLLVFTRGAGSPQQDGYGYFVTQGISGDLMWVERFADPPWPMRLPTDQIHITPRISLRSEKRRLRTGL